MNKDFKSKCRRKETPNVKGAIKYKLESQQR